MLASGEELPIAGKHVEGIHWQYTARELAGSSGFPHVKLCLASCVGASLSLHLMVIPFRVFTTQLVKFLPCMHEVPSLNPQYPTKKLECVPAIAALEGGRDRRIPGTW